MELHDIQKHITHFSEEIRLKAIHGEEVVVGGKIESIVPPLSDEHPMYVVILDDQVGTSHVFIPSEMYDAFSSRFQVGQYVFIEGFVKVMSRSIRKETTKDVSIYGYGLKDITNNMENSI